MEGFSSLIQTCSLAVLPITQVRCYAPSIMSIRWADAIYSFAALVLGLAAIPIAYGMAPRGPLLAMILSALGAVLAVFVVDSESNRSRVTAITAFILNIVSFWALGIALAMGVNLGSLFSGLP
jgi:hypothetical protein